ncbi:MAG: DUF6152 family protein [Steroidobacteraceae bacterium]
MKFHFAAALALGFSGAAFAHHSFSMFDMDKDVTLEGSVIEYRFGNPHSHIIIKVPAGKAQAEYAGNWDVEGGSATIMRRQGWSRETFKPGDGIKIVGHPMRDGTKGISLFYAIMPDGTRLYHDIARPKAD